MGADSGGRGGVSFRPDNTCTSKAGPRDGASSARTPSQTSARGARAGRWNRPFPGAWGGDSSSSLPGGFPGSTGDGWGVPGGRQLRAQPRPTESLPPVATRGGGSAGTALPGAGSQEAGTPASSGPGRGWRRAHRRARRREGPGTAGTAGCWSGGRSWQQGRPAGGSGPRAGNLAGRAGEAPPARPPAPRGGRARATGPAA